MTNPPAVLLGGQNMAVSIARSLGRHGIPVHALGDSTWDHVRHSRFCTAFADLGGTDADRRLEWLEREGPRGGVLLPCDDEGLQLVARRRADITALGYKPVEANDEALLAMLDKERTYELAREAGVPAPRTVPIRGAEDLAAAAAEIGFPCALKPIHSHEFAHHFSARHKVWIASDAAALEREAGRMSALGLEMIATEIVAGPDDSYSSCYTYMGASGEPLVHYTKRKLRQQPIHFGLGTYHLTQWDDETAELGLRFLRSVGVQGLANVEFKRDARDGRLKLIECNHRFTAATELVRASGVDLALFTYNRLLGRPLPPVGPQRDGTRLWLPVEDFRAFRAYRAAGELTTREWIGSLLHPQRFSLLAADDPKPALASWRRMARRLLAGS